MIHLYLARVGMTVADLDNLIHWFRAEMRREAQELFACLSG